MSNADSTRLLAVVEQAMRGYDMERGGFDYDGTRPCIPPAVLAAVVSRALLRVRVARDEAEVLNPRRANDE